MSEAIAVVEYTPCFYRRNGLGSYPLPGFGPPIGFVVNFATNHAVWFDLEGEAVEVLPKAHRSGTQP